MTYLYKNRGRQMPLALEYEKSEECEVGQSLLIS